MKVTGKNICEDDQLSEHSSMYDNLSDFDEDEEEEAVLDDKQLVELAKARNISISFTPSNIHHSVKKQGVCVCIYVCTVCMYVVVE